MRTEVVLHAGGEPARRALEGSTTLGGSQADGIVVAGIAPAALSLEPCAAGVLARPAVAGLRVAGRPVPPGATRLLRHGERATLACVSIELPRPPAVDATRVGAAALLRDAACGGAVPAGPHLVVVTGPDAGTRVAVRTEALVLGRGRAATLRLRDPAASRRHARIRRGPRGVTLEDLGSKNRLRVNGVAVERRPVPLRPGDRITIGETELVYDDGARPRERPRPRGPPSRARRGRPGPGPPLVAAALLAAAAAALGVASSCGL